MHNYQHTVSGAFSRRDLAEGALYQLTRRGLRSEHLQIIAVEETDEEKAEALVSQRAELLRWLRYGIVGTAMGVVCSVLLEVALLLGAPSPLATWLLLGPAMLIGWGALLGALLGCAVGAVIIWQPLQSTAEEDVLLVAQTHSVQETSIARKVLKASAGQCQDVDMHTAQNDGLLPQMSPRNNRVNMPATNIPRLPLGQ